MKKYRMLLASLFIASAAALPACGAANVTEAVPEVEQSQSQLETDSDTVAEAEQSQASDETYHGMIAEVAREPKP